MLSQENKEKLIDSGYRIVGPNSHSAVEVCRWTKKSMLDEGFCYKQKFYEGIHGIQSHRCLQMTPSLPFCDNRCMFCWRNVEISETQWEGETDDPESILNEAVEAQRKLLSGFKGNPEANIEKWREAQNPTLCAISLDGEPTLYPKINGLIEECKRREITPFLVTNGQHPNILESLEEPAQLYISAVAPDKKTYSKICRPQLPDYWERLKRSLEVLPSLECVKVLRLTLVDGWNLRDPSGYASLIDKAEPDFVEPKGYMFVGHSRKRLKKRNMPDHKKIKDFSARISDLTGYEIVDESEASRVCLLSRTGRY
ncbi:MAG: 4-demethylwyosine synthase TYW1 [Candidatus Hadarchaeia archaeon]